MEMRVRDAATISLVDERAARPGREEKKTVDRLLRADASAFSGHRGQVCVWPPRFDPRRNPSLSFGHGGRARPDFPLLERKRGVGVARRTAEGDPEKRESRLRRISVNAKPRKRERGTVES